MVISLPSEPANHNVNELISIDRFEVFAAGLDHPECVAFDREGNAWAGGEAGQVYRIDANGAVEEVAHLGSFNAGLAFSQNDELFVCNPAQGIIRIDRRNGQQDVFASEAAGEKIICANFPLFDRAGNLYVSDSGQWMKRNGRLLRFTPDGRGEVLIDSFGYANGLALDEQRGNLFIAESDTNRVYSCRLSSDGALSDPTPLADVERMPDGLALDDAGNLYVACYASDDIWRIDRGGQSRRFAHDPWAIRLSRPTNLTFRGGYVYVANLGRYTITRAQL